MAPGTPSSANLALLSLSKVTEHRAFGSELKIPLSSGTCRVLTCDRPIGSPPPSS